MFEELISPYDSHPDCRTHDEELNKTLARHGSEIGEKEREIIFYTHLIAALIVTRINSGILIRSILTIETE